MIVSHKHKFIFVKTLKTAGTSFEVALAKVCGVDDVVTPISPAVHGHHAQNAGGYYNHMPAEQIRKSLGDDIWSNYFKFTIERNPWDKEVSWYWFLKRKYDYQDSFREFCIKGFLSGPDDFPEAFSYKDKVSSWLLWHKINTDKRFGAMEMLKRKYILKEDFQGYPMDFDRYSIDGQVAVDFVARFENLQQDFTYIKKYLKLDEKLSLPFEKSSSRNNDLAGYREHYDDITRNLISLRYKREIGCFKYSY